MLMAAAAAALAGALIGAPTLRLRGDYIAVVTLAFGEIVAQIVYNGRGIALFGGTLTAGLVGVGLVDRIELPLVGRLGPSDLRGVVLVRAHARGAGAADQPQPPPLADRPRVGRLA